MSTVFKKATFALIALTALAACTPRMSQTSSLLPLTGQQVTRADETPPPCTVLCDSDGGMP
jgi:hypothetical protein